MAEVVTSVVYIFYRSSGEVWTGIWRECSGQGKVDNWGGLGKNRNIKTSSEKRQNEGNVGEGKEAWLSVMALLDYLTFTWSNAILSSTLLKREREREEEEEEEINWLFT